MRFLLVMAAGGMVLAAALGYKLQEVAANYRSAIDELSEVHGDLRKEQTTSQQLMALNQDVRPGLTLSGVDALSQDEIAFGPIESAVLYVFDTDCPYSPENVQVLHQLHSSGLPVLGVVTRDPLPSVQAFVRTYDLQFPVVLAPEGDPVDILPRAVTPLTAVFIDGNLRHLWLGVLDEEKRAQISAVRDRSLPAG